MQPSIKNQFVRLVKRINIPLPRRVLFATASVVLFGIYSFLAIQSTHQFTSPDETANYFFARTVATQHTLRVPQQTASDIVTPRSIQATNGYLVPASFLGLPLLYGIIGAATSPGVIEFLTPLFSVLAILAWYDTIWLLFANKRVAFFSAALLALHPAFVYYTGRGLFHNALLLDLLLIAGWLLVRAITYQAQGRLWYYAAAGITLSAALVTRTSEVVWIAPSLLAIALIYRTKFDWRAGVWIGIVAGICVLASLLFINKSLYNNPFSSGYTLIENAPQDSGMHTGSSDTILAIKELVSRALFPFGVDFKLAAQTGWTFLVVLIWPFAILTGMSMARIARTIAYEHFNALKNPWVVYTFFFVGISMFLVLYYGSWYIQDNPIPTRHVGLEQSYARYFLPIYALATPLAAFLLSKLRSWHIALTLGVIMFVSFQTAGASDISGLAKIKTNTIEYKEILQQTQAALPPSAIVVTNTSDKIFFPTFQVIRTPGLFSPSIATEIKRLLAQNKILYLYVDAANPSDPLLLTSCKTYHITATRTTSLADGDQLYQLTLSK